jgi:hypothetical protein
MQLFEVLENVLIAISRYFLIIAGTLSFIGAIVFLIYSLILISDKPNYSNNDITKSTFSDFRYQLFPQKLVQQSNQQDISGSNNELSEKEQSIPINPKFKELKEYISYHFNDSQKMIDQFASNITARSLEEYISSNYLTEISYTYHDDFLNNLLNLFESMKNNVEIKRIGKFEGRMEVVSDLIDLFSDDFDKKINESVSKNQQAEFESSSNNIKGFANMQYVLYGLAIYAIVVLYLMIFKVEIDLRRIPKAINSDKE